MVIYYQSDFTITERMVDAGGVALDISSMDFEIVFSTSGYNTYTASKHGSECVNCVVDADDNSLLHVNFDNHGLKPGALVQVVTFLTEPPVGFEGTIQDISKRQYVIDKDMGHVLLGIKSSACTPSEVRTVCHADFIKGDSAYRCAVLHGFQGNEEEWLQSLVGQTGERGPKGDTGEAGEKGEQGISGGLLFPALDFDPETGVLIISGLEQEIDRVRYDEATGELVIRLYN